MKVCAAIQLGMFNRMSLVFPSIAAAVDYFRSEIAGVDFGMGIDEQVMDLYPQCDQGSDLRCTDNMTFHDYPMVRYAIGPRGGVQRQNT